MFKTSSRSFIAIAGLLLACSLPLREAYSQDTSAPRILIESVRLPQTSPSAFINRFGVTRDDLRNIRKRVGGTNWVIPMRTIFTEARYGAETFDIRVCGTDENYSHKLNPEKLRGRFLLDKDVTHFNNVAVIGDQVAKTLFGNRDPIGRNIRVERDYYLIVGRLESPILQPKFQVGPVADHSRSVFIPISTMKTRMGDDQIVREEGSFSAVSFELTSIEILPENANQAFEIRNSIQRLLEANHPQQDYRVRLLR